MNEKFEIELGSIEISSYEDILSIFGNWKKYKREININQLLEEGKKIQFDVEIENKQSVLFISTIYDESEIVSKSITNACAAINKMTFIIKNNDVVKLEVEVKLLTTNWGKDIKSIIESGVELKLQQHINIEGQVDNFYFEMPKQAA